MKARVDHLERSLSRAGDVISSFREKQVRIGQTVSLNYAYPSQPANTFEVWLGKPSFIDTPGDQATTFEGYTPQEDWVRVAHDKQDRYWNQGDLVYVRLMHGDWYIVDSKEFCGIIRFRINQYFSGDGYAEVDILARLCGCDEVSEETGTGTGETVRVYDNMGCMFNEPAEDLVGRIGYAAYMIDELMVGGGPDTGTGTGPDDCEWEVFSLCCPTC